MLFQYFPWHNLKPWVSTVGFSICIVSIMGVNFYLQRYLFHLSLYLDYDTKIVTFNTKSENKEKGSGACRCSVTPPPSLRLQKWNFLTHQGSLRFLKCTFNQTLVKKIRLQKYKKEYLNTTFRANLFNN